MVRAYGGFVNSPLPAPVAPVTMPAAQLRRGAAMRASALLVAGLLAAGPASAEEITTLAKVERINWLLLATDPLQPATSQQCALGTVALAEDLGQALRRLGFRTWSTSLTIRTSGCRPSPSMRRPSR
jgi:hypothetical protein